MLRVNMKIQVVSATTVYNPQFSLQLFIAYKLTASVLTKKLKDW